MDKTNPANPPSGSSGEERRLTELGWVKPEKFEAVCKEVHDLKHELTRLQSQAERVSNKDRIIYDMTVMDGKMRKRISELIAENMELQTQLSRLQSQQAEGMRWIPISEGLPPVDPGEDSSIYVLVTAGQFTKHSKQLIFEKSYYNFYFERWQFAITSPTHWMRIVEPSAPTPDKNREI